MPMIDKTEEDAGKGYQILGAINSKDNRLKKNEVTLWEALTNGAKGFEKWFNVFINGISMLALLIIIFSMLGGLIYFLYKITSTCYKIL